MEGGIIGGLCHSGHLGNAALLEHSQYKTLYETHLVKMHFDFDRFRDQQILI